MEVLISIFVLSVGLLGVAAVIPVAGHEILEATKADRSAACGQAALHDIRVRGTLDPDDWRDVNGDPLGEREPDWPPPDAYQSTDRGYKFGESYALDPLFIADHLKGAGVNTSHYTDFPYNPTNPGSPWLGVTWTRMQRVTWNRVASFAQTPELNSALTGLMFKWHDDPLFNLPPDERERPQQAMIMDTGAANPLKADFDGHYSWLVTATPSPEHIDFTADPDGDGTYVAYSFPENSPLYTVSVAVFYKRDMSLPGDYSGTGIMAGETPAERQVPLRFLGDGLGGGDVLLRAASDPGDPTTWLPANYLDIKENEWLLVSGYYNRDCYYQNPDSGPDYYQAPYSNVGVHKWYRIVATGDIVVEDRNGNLVLDAGEDTNGNSALDPPYREVTLAGPDWNVAAWGSNVVVGLFNGIVGVYSTTMELSK